MTRLERLMKTVRAEQAVALLRPSAENVAELRLVQDRLLKYALRSDQSVPYDLFFFPPVIEENTVPNLWTKSKRQAVLCAFHFDECMKKGNGNE